MTTYELGEDNCKHTYDKQSISKIYKVFPQINSKQSKEPNNPIRIRKVTEQILLQIKHTYGQQAHDKVLNITNSQCNANPNNYVSIKIIN